MFIIQEPEIRIPIKIWLEDRSDLEESCYQQAINLSQLPFAHHHIALMPDTHTGYGMPIGGVLATTADTVVPNAVGVDIGCGVNFIHTNIPVKLLSEVKSSRGLTLAHEIVRSIMEQVPVGFDHHKQPQKSDFLERVEREKPYFLLHYGNQQLPTLEEAKYQIGTLGGGNHFIELQTDEQGMLGIMLHSGSRNFGYKVANYFNNIARQENKRDNSPVPDSHQLAYLNTESETGKGYLGWMNLALDFARENRALMMERVINAVFDHVTKEAKFTDIQTSLHVNAHHNYAALEHHYGKDVLVHRKGAIRAEKGELGIIPGAMGSYSYIVEGLGNPKSFNSASHGAGRVMGRKEALRQFTPKEVEKDLAEQGVIAFGKRRRNDVPEEYRLVYKDIDQVMTCQTDLVKPILKLKTVAVIKG